MTERAVVGVTRIRSEEYEPVRAHAHAFLVGDLQKKNSNPFFRDARIELISCYYQAGEHGEFHWHPAVTEYEMVLDGTVGYRDAMTGETTWMRAGDCSVVPAGTCVRRLTPESARTIAIKVPSDPIKIGCRNCRRQCEARVTPFESD